MGHFIINLPNNQQGDVRFGIVQEKSSFFSLFKNKQAKSDIKRAYVIRIENDSLEHSEYHLLKTSEGIWISENAGGFYVSPEDEMSIIIKEAIDSYESQH